MMQKDIELAPPKKTKVEQKVTHHQAQHTVFTDKDYILPSNYTKELQDDFFHKIHFHAKSTTVGDEILPEGNKHFPCDCKGFEVVGQTGFKTVCNNEMPLNCYCCGRYVEKKPVKLGQDTLELDFLGAGFPLFFEFIKYCGYFLIILVLSAGSYNFFSNSLRPDCRDSTSADNHCKLTFVSRFSLADKRHNQDLNDLQMILNIFSIGALIVLLQIFRKNQREIDEKCDSGDINDSDYTIEIKDLPRDDQSISRAQIVEFLNKNFASILKGDQILEHNISFSYDVQELIDKQTQKQNKVLEYQAKLKVYYAANQGATEAQRQAKPLEGEGQIVKEIENLEKEVDEVGEKFANNDQSIQNKFTGVCFVSLNSENQKVKILEYASKNKLTIKDQSNQDHELTIHQAPDPTDVYWENLHHTLNDKRKRRFVSFLVNAVALFLCFAVIFWLSNIQRTLNKELNPGIDNLCSQHVGTVGAGTTSIYKGSLNHDHSFAKHKAANSPSSTAAAEKSAPQPSVLSASQSSQDLKIKLITMLISIVVIPGFNAVLLQIMTRTTEFEKYSTRTENQISLATKLSIGMFFNTALQTFIIKIVLLWSTECLESARQAVFTDGGLIYTQENVLMMNSFQPAIIYLIDGGRIFQQLQKWWYLSKNKNTCTLTQSQANKIAEEVPYLIAPRYAFIMNTMFTTAFYAPLLPIGLFWSLLALVIIYWVEKYKIFKQRVIEFNLSSHLSTEMTELLELFLPLYCTANLVFEYLILKTVENQPDGDTNAIVDMYNKSSNYAKIGILVGIVHCILPMKEINKYIMPTKPAPVNTFTHQEAKKFFATTYNKQNPATKEEEREKQLQNHHH